MGFINGFFDSFSRKKDEQSLIQADSDIRDELICLKEKIQIAQNNLNETTDAEEISFYIYIIKAYEIRFNTLFKKAKELQGAV